jgi:hypothetical protein
VSVYGLNLSGLTAEDAARQISAGVAYPYSGRILFRDGERTWAAAPAELGLNVDLGWTMSGAYGVGRMSNPLFDAFQQLATRFFGSSAPLVVQYDASRAQAYLQRIAAEIDRPVQEASVELVGTQVIAHEGQIGRQLDLATNLALAAVPLGGLTDAEIPLVVQQIVPQVLDPDEQAAWRGSCSASLSPSTCRTHSATRVRSCFSPSNWRACSPSTRQTPAARPPSLWRCRTTNWRPSWPRWWSSSSASRRMRATSMTTPRVR